LQDFFLPALRSSAFSFLRVEIPGSVPNKKGLDGNPAPFKIQYPMKNQALDSHYALSVACNQEKYWPGSTNKKKEPG